MIAHSVAEIVKPHLRLTVEGIDRMYLNVYVPGLQEHGINRFSLPPRSAAAVGGADEPDDLELCGDARRLCGPAWDDL